MASVYVADAGIYGGENMIRLAKAGVERISRVPQRSTAARSLIEEALDAPGHHRREGQEDGNKLRLFFGEEVCALWGCPKGPSAGWW